MLPSLLWICLMSRLVYPTLILYTILTNILFPLGKMIGMVRSLTSFILSSQSWEISSPPGCRQEEIVLRRARIGHTHLTHSYILKKDPPPQCEQCQSILTVHHILVECSHFAKKKEEDIFGKRNVLESFSFHLTLNIFYLKEFYNKLNLCICNEENLLSSFYCL